MTTLSPVTLADFLAARAGASAPGLVGALEKLAETTARIARLVNRAAIDGALGTHGTENVQGEVQKELDVVANDIFLDAFAGSTAVGGLASEEMDDIHPIGDGPMLILFDPIDGSSNIDVDLSVGTIFSLLQRQGSGALSTADFLQPGTSQLAAGYVIYGPQTLMLLTLGDGVFEFAFDPDTGGWLQLGDRAAVKPAAREFAINASNHRHWAAPVRRYVDECLAGRTGPRGADFNMRWAGSMVADLHRILKRGGIFLYPWDAREPGRAGKLRLLYEANPMSLLVEQAGGAAFDATTRMLEITPTELHQRVGVIIGSREEVERVVDYHRQ